MRDTVSLKATEEGGDIDYESFIQTKNETESGMATLKKAKRQDGQDIDGFARRFLKSKLDGDARLFSSDFLVFESEMGGEDIEVILVEDSDKQWETIEKWTGTKDLTFLAGKEVPIRRIKGNIYTIEPFENGSMKHTNAQKLMYESGLIEFDGTKWRTSDKYDDYKKSLRRLQILLNMSGVMAATVAMFFALAGMFVVWGFLMFVWMISFFGSIYTRTAGIDSPITRRLH